MEMEAKRWWSAFPLRLNARRQDSCLNCRNNAVNLVRDPPAGGEPQSSEPATVIARSCQCDRRTSCGLNGGQISQVVAEALPHCR